MSTYTIIGTIGILFGGFLAMPAGAQDIYTRTDVRDAVKRIERDGDRFKSEFNKALEHSKLSAGEQRVRDTAKDLEDEVDNLKKNFEHRKYKEAKENLENSMLMASSIDRFMFRNYFGPEARQAWDTLRADLNVIASAYDIMPLPVYQSGITGTPAVMSAARSADRVQVAEPPSDRGRPRLEREIRHELVMLPYYGVFDNLAYRVDGGTVTLMGQVTRPTLKSSAENVVKDIEGVERVVNNIEVLPVSPSDDRIRAATFQAIYGQSQLNRYALQAVPPIHIIVRNGNVTLEGVVASAADRDIANMQARSVPGVFSVTNNLRVE